MRGGNLMFGHQDDDQQMLNDQAAAVQTPTTDDLPSGAPLTAHQNDENASVGMALPTPSDDASLTQPDSGTLTHDDSSTPSPSSDFKATDNTNDLLDIKQKALSQLSPIVDRLDQSPEERFNTTMMMIQASDNQELINKAYEAAQQITDEKLKAQALLDIVNEINYFTHPHQD